MKKLFCVLTVVCMLAMLVAVGSMSASAAEFEGNKDKVTPKLLEAIEKSGEGDLLPVIVRYKAVVPSGEEYDKVRDAVVAEIFDASNEPGTPTNASGSPAFSVSYDTIQEILEQSGFSAATEEIINGIKERLSNPEEFGAFDEVNVGRFVRIMLVKSVYKMQSDEIIASLGIQEEQILYQSTLMAEMHLSITVSEIEKLSNDERILLLDLCEQDPTYIEPTATGTATKSVVLGDANDDGAVNMKDVLVLRKVLADIAVEYDEMNADVNGDGELNMKDVLIVRKFLAGIISGL